MIKIASKRHNFRRCGIAHPKGPVEHSDDRFTKKELAILVAEPMLIVEVTVDGHTEQRPDDSEPGEQILGLTADSDLIDAAREAISLKEDPLIAAAREAILRGKTTGDGKPLVAAMEEIMGRDISAAERDLIWESIRE